MQIFEQKNVEMGIFAEIFVPLRQNIDKLGQVMKKYIVLSLFALLAVSASAQKAEQGKEQAESAAKVISMPKTEWLPSYNKVVVEGLVNVVFKQTDSNESLKIIYDQKGATTSRFRAGVDKKGVLTISERPQSKEHTTVTEVTVWYNSLQGITVDGATVVFEDVVESQLLDLKVKSKASLTLAINALDALVECTGKSNMQLSGQSRYFKLSISTATMSGFDLKTMASNIDASHDAEVRISVSERLEAITSTSAQIYYKGEPAILRTKNSLFGGEIAAVN